MLFINPDECIDCGACVPECPVTAIFHDQDVPAEWESYIALNAEKARQYPPIRERKTPSVEP
jgi:ferredoxin